MPSMTLFLPMGLFIKGSWVENEPIRVWDPLRQRDTLPLTASARGRRGFKGAWIGSRSFSWVQLGPSLGLRKYGSWLGEMESGSPTFCFFDFWNQAGVQLAEK